MPPAQYEDTGAVASITRAEADTQIVTAKKYPRSIKTFMDTAKGMVTMDVETAEGCFYKLKRKNPDGSVKFIEGPSVRLLEIAAAAYGNLTYGARIISEDARFITAQGVAWDLQNNNRQTLEVRRRITTKTGATFGEDMIAVTANAACSIAKRNALNGVIPRVFVNQLFEIAKQTAVGKLGTLAERRQKAVDYFVKNLHVPLEKILLWLEVKGIEDIQLDHLESLSGLKTALKDGETTVEKEFNDLNNTSAAPEFDKKAPAETAAGKAPATTQAQPLTELKQMIEADGLTEADALSYFKTLGSIEETLSTLDEVSLVKPSVIIVIKQAWKTAAKEIKKAKKAATQPAE